MSVTIEGIKGYEYQYKVTVLISLLCHVEKIKLFVEKEGSEDALLVLEKDSITKRIEIQVKREKNNIDILKLTNWLCHFQERKSDNNLLQKIINYKDDIALFITHSRCSDDTVILKTDINSFKTHDTLLISNEWKDKFITSLKNQNLGKTDLMKKREQFCQDQSENITSNTELSKILEQVLIWEEFSDEKVNSQVVQLLNTEYNIAQSKTYDVYLRLLEVVKAGRDSGKNILEAINKILKVNKIGRPLIDSVYKSRSEEENLIEHLTTNNALLLTGTSQCGKSELAKKVSIHFFDKGYDYKRTDNIEEIKRFFSTNTSDNKIAILEDPWGHITPIEEYEQFKCKIEDIILNAESHHKLIITSRLEILFEIFETENLDKCKIKSFKWFDLTINNRSIINKYWLSLSRIKTISEEITNLVSDSILNSGDQYLLQIGQLRYLANEEPENLMNKSYPELEHLARRNSKEIANAIKQKNDYYSEILSVIAMCATQIHSIGFTDLAYILSDKTDRISITSKDVFTSSFREENPSFPEYPNDIYLPENAKKAIEYLEERQLITASNNKASFSHPNYYEAGRYLFFSQSESKQKRILKYLIKCISCLSPSNSYLSTKQFSFIYYRIKKSLREDIINIAFESLDSIFPSVEDSSLIFLMNVIEDIPEELVQELIRRIQSGGTSSSNIYWHNGEIPFISNSGGFFNWLVEVEDEIVRSVEGKLSNKKLPNIYEAWMYLESLKDGRPVQFELFMILLQYNEAFIRIKVVYQIFKRLDEKNKNVVLEIFNDEHPSVVFSAIRATFINWFKLPQKLREFIFDLIKKSLNKQQISIRAFNLISTFSLDYGHEAIFNCRDFDDKQKKEIWNLWGELYPIIVKNVPLGVIINTARFGATMNDAIKHLDVNVGVIVLESWLERIDYQIKNNRILDDFEMAVAKDLMELTSDDCNIRKDIFSRLVNYNDTSFILSNLKWIIDYWETLDISEKDQITNLIQSNRKDLRWIKAVLLTCSSPPEEICLCILGEKDIFKKEIEYSLSKFSDQLLQDCLNVYCGFPQPLWWLAVHHNNINFWGKVIRHILLDESHIGFEICLEEFLNNGVNGFTEEWEDWEILWEQICNNTKEKKLLADSLLYNTARCTCIITTTNKLWTILIKSYSSKENEIIDIIVENIEMLQQTGDKEDLSDFFDNEFLIDKIIPALIPDSILINVLRDFKTNPFFKDEDKIEMIMRVNEITVEKNIRFFETFNFFENLKKEDNIPNEVKVELSGLSNMIDEIGKEKLEEKRQKYEYKLNDWIGIN